MRKFFTFHVVLNKQKELHKQYEPIWFKSRFTISIIIFSEPPLRQENITLNFQKKLERKEYWFVIKCVVIYMDWNEIKWNILSGPAIMFNLTKDAYELAENCVVRYYKLYPGEFLFAH